jgi:hypothetical protein
LDDQWSLMGTLSSFPCHFKRVINDSAKLAWLSTVRFARVRSSGNDLPKATRRRANGRDIFALHGSFPTAHPATREWDKEQKGEDMVGG